MSDRQAHDHAQKAHATSGDVDPMGDLGSCAEAYEELEYCLADNQRDWRKCQDAVKAVRQCMAKQQQRQEMDTDQQPRPG